MEDPSLPLTPQEIQEGWHFCPDWDGLLVGVKMKELEVCCCDLPIKKPEPTPPEIPPGMIFDSINL